MEWKRRYFCILKKQKLIPEHGFLILATSTSCPQGDRGRFFRRKGLQVSSSRMLWVPTFVCLLPQVWYTIFCTAELPQAEWHPDNLPQAAGLSMLSFCILKASVCHNLWDLFGLAVVPLVRGCIKAAGRLPVWAIFLTSGLLIWLLPGTHSNHGERAWNGWALHAKEKALRIVKFICIDGKNQRKKSYVENRIFHVPTKLRNYLSAFF